MASSASTTHDLHGITTTPAPPPPTPSNEALAKSLSSDAEDVLSRLFHQLLTTPTLSSPPRSRTPTKLAPEQPPPPPLVSLIKDPDDLLLSAAANFGYFHVTDHGISSHVHASALLEAQSLLLSRHPFSSNSSLLGFNHDGVDEESSGENLFLVLDASSEGLDSSPALREYVKCLERVGMELVEKMFPNENPFRGSKPRCLLWVLSSSSTAAGIKEEEEEEEEEEGRVGWRRNKSYPDVLCLQYQTKLCWVLGNSDEWVSIAPSADSVLVTLGDIAQVWSNGRFKKVRGIPESAHRYSCDSSDCISMSFLLTLPMDSIISPLLALAPNDHDSCSNDDVEEGDKDTEQRFWRVHHEQLSFKDSVQISDLRTQSQSPSCMKN